jgi:hypothetical protein
VIVHLSILAGVLIFAEVHQFGPVTAEEVAVDIVLPEEAPASKAEAPLPPPPEAPALPEPKAQSSDPSRPAAKPEAAAQPPQPPPSKQPSNPEQPLVSKQAAVQPPSPPPVPAAIPRQPEPDLSVKYHVMLGLPSNDVGGGFEAAEKNADVGTGRVAEFRRHLRTCSTLPKSVAPTDAVKITLRVFMTPDGRLAREPVLTEASASIKGPALMQSAINALQACQPYAMLPADRYGEWKVLDLSFTPQDFAGG